jgi:hypothetical protein
VIRYASQRSEAEGGRRIVLALDRYLSFWEVANRPRTIDYPFTFVEIKIDKNGEGEGKLSICDQGRLQQDHQPDPARDLRKRAGTAPAGQGEPESVRSRRFR